VLNLLDQCKNVFFFSSVSLKKKGIHWLKMWFWDWFCMQSLCIWINIFNWDGSCFWKEPVPPLISQIQVVDSFSFVLGLYDAYTWGINGRCYVMLMAVLKGSWQIASVSLKGFHHFLFDISVTKPRVCARKRQCVCKQVLPREYFIYLLDNPRFLFNS